jgi:antitoxin ParD1/3/4
MHAILPVKAWTLMDIYLTRDLEEFVKNEVQSGRYNSTSEVIADALRLLDERERGRAALRADFNRELDRRLAEADAGHFVDPAVVFARIQQRSAERRKKPA